MKYNIKTTIDIKDMSGDNMLLKKYPFLNLIRQYQYNNHLCFNYALNIEGEFSCTEAFEIVKENYIQIPLKVAREGDLIVYHDDDGINEYVEHFAIIKEIKGTLKSIIITSKWGRNGIYEGNIFDVPNIYGNKITIWRKI